MSDEPPIRRSREDRIRARARAHRRRLLRGLGVQARDLDAVTREWLRLYAEGAARAELLPPDSKDAWTAFNSTTRALRQLADRLRELGLVASEHGDGGLAGLEGEGRRLRLAAEEAR